MTGITPQAQPEPVALFISDLHLHPSCPKTAQAFHAFLRGPARQTQQLFLLGDIFESWAGDDDLATPWNREICDAIRAVSDAGVEIGWIGGNRDFLVGKKFAREAGFSLLADPHVVTLAGQRIVLTHGDALCTDDVGYMAFRAKVRNTLAQKLFLAMPLSKRKSIIEGMRSDSVAAQKAKTSAIMDVNAGAVDELFAQTGAEVMIHGHTHRPARHDLADGKRTRHVLTDWDADSKPERGGWLALFSDGTLRRFDIKGRMVT
ncbi:MAG: UDP-2,3-diacylglucosamine hydrolase protein [Burkholderiaceae bacterium]|nr:UDP-2,3-diacylglucosamine hydrolase protein [Burkholderiaceae bacterium]